MRRSATVIAFCISLAAYAAGCSSAQTPAQTQQPGGTTATPTAPDGQNTPSAGQPTAPPADTSPTPGGPTAPAEQTAPPEDCSYDFNAGGPFPDVAAAPADVSGLLEWLTTNCPGATWLTRIMKIEYVPGEVPDWGGYPNAIVVTTDLDFATEQVAALEIGPALGEAHPSWADHYVVWYADGQNGTSGDIVDWTP